MSKKNGPSNFGHKEVLIEKPGAMIALKVDAVLGSPVFAIREVNTTVAKSPSKATIWVEQQIENGSQIVLILGPDGWFLKATESDFEFSEAQVMSFFPQPFLQNLWLSHHPVTKRRDQFFELLKGEQPN